MTKETYALLERYMHACMDDSAHDAQHIYRVLYAALDIARTEEGVDTDILIAACLLHDIGRREQFADPSVCHAAVGGEKAYGFLLEQGFGAAFADAVRHCIQSHRFRRQSPPQTIEAKILFDADKLDATGAVGIARTLNYQGIVGAPMYSLTPEGGISDGTGDTAPSFFREYKFKLEGLYDRFYTKTGAALAARRQAAATAYYNALYAELTDAFQTGQAILQRVVD